MAFVIKALGAGTVAITGSNLELYTVPAGKSQLVSNVRFANNGVNIANITFLVRPSGAGTSRRLSGKDVSLPVGGAVIMEDAVTLGQGDKLQVNVSGASPSIGWMANGVERE